MASISDNDWRLQERKPYLQGASFKLMPWASKNPQQWDHDHCEFCRAKFAGQEIPDALHEGYGTKDLYYWVCPACFEDFREHFGFKVFA